jgi:hypothetical protein
VRTKNGSGCKDKLLDGESVEVKCKPESGSKGELVGGEPEAKKRKEDEI